jgi:hypothetical protein
VDISLQCGQAKYATLQPGLVHLDIKHISSAVLDYIDLGIFDTKNGQTPCEAFKTGYLIRFKQTEKKPSMLLR